MPHAVPGEVRFGYELAISTPPLPSRPQRLESSSLILAELVAAHAIDVVVQGDAFVHEGVLRGEQVEHAAIVVDDVVHPQRDLLDEVPAQVPPCRWRKGRCPASGVISGRRVRFSHCAPKLLDSVIERGSASMRTTCAFSTAGSCSLSAGGQPAAACRRAGCSTGRTTVAKPA